MSKKTTLAAPDGPINNRMVSGSAPESGMVVVRALTPLHEDGHKDAGATWRTSANRAKELGNLIVVVKE